jgi:hypothetical protein
MAYNFLRGDRDQPFLPPPDLRDWLPEGHLAWFILDIVDQLDLQPLYRQHRDDGHGHPAYDPKLLLGVLLSGYCLGVRSSRQRDRFARSIWRPWTHSAASAPGIKPIGSQNQPHRSSRPPSSRPITQLSAQPKSNDATTTITQRRSGARSVASARPTAMAATRGSGWPSPRHTRRMTAWRVRRSSCRQAWAACFLRGVAMFASPITFRDGDRDHCPDDSESSIPCRLPKATDRFATRCSTCQTVT